MKFKYLMLTIVLVIGLAVPVQAKDLYVRGVNKITMRTGPGTDKKIIAMLISGTKLQILKYQKDWSMVETSKGKQGWVLSRFLTEEIPKAIMVQRLEKENQDLVAALDEARRNLKQLEERNTVLTKIEKQYGELKKASADYLKLDAEHKALLKTSQDQKIQIRNLEESLDDEEKLWFLSGAGVFIVGLILGLSTRKKKSSSLLS